MKEGKPYVQCLVDNDLKQCENIAAGRITVKMGYCLDICLCHRNI